MKEWQKSRKGERGEREKEENYKTLIEKQCDNLVSGHFVFTKKIFWRHVLSSSFSDILSSKHNSHIFFMRVF